MIDHWQTMIDRIRKDAAEDNIKAFMLILERCKRVSEKLINYDMEKYDVEEYYYLKLEKYGAYEQLNMTFCYVCEEKWIPRAEALEASMAACKEIMIGWPNKQEAIYLSSSMTENIGNWVMKIYPAPYTKEEYENSKID